MENFKIITAENLDSQYVSIADKISDTVISASYRTLLNFESPGRYQMPAGDDSLEHDIKSYLNTIPEAELQTGIRKIVQPGFIPKISDERLFRSIDMQSSYSVINQVFNDPDGGLRPLSLRVDLENKGNSNLIMNVNQLYCAEETGPTSKGSDHVYMQAVRIDAFGNTRQSPLLDLEGGWDNKNHVNWKNRGDIKNLVNFNLDYGRGWPRKCTVVVAMSVRSSEGLIKLIDKIAEKAKEEIVKYAAATAGALVGAKAGAVLGSTFGPIGTIAGAVAGAVVGAIVAYVFDKLYAWFKDLFSGTKLFKPATLEYTIPYNGYKTNNEGYTVTWTGHNGQYEAQIEAVLEWGKGTGVPTAIKHGKFTNSTVYKVNNENKIGFYWNSGKWSNTGKWGDTKGMASVDSPICTVGNFDKGELNILVIGLDGKVWHSGVSVELLKKIEGHPFGEYRGWQPVIDGQFILGTKVAGASRGENMIDIFCVGTDGQIWTAAKGPQTNNVWAGWWTINGMNAIPGTPLSAISRSAGILDVFVAGFDGRVWTASYDPSSSGTWTDWFYFLDYDQFIPGIEITAITRKENQIDLFAIDMYGSPYTATWNPGEGWQGWTKILSGEFTPGTTVSVACRTPEHLDIFAIGLDGRVWTAAKGPQTNNEWAGWWPIGDPVFEEGSAIAAISTFHDMLNIFVTGKDGNTYAATFDGEKWNWDNIG
ncbi:hypothetical protein HNP38_001969 [Chryseobacterium defluvii]|uniref:Uncharacterized protein n=1 Tax=Chryseobacterium defluvii TaxID=160396 RepID=A0A840KGM2_9FLAO|nr:hypothetical protein [Chryseobacterium defluvii]MBB4806673.1 hypothetical protein [Chryseobacterium defluvii]